MRILLKIKPDSNGNRKRQSSTLLSLFLGLFGMKLEETFEFPKKLFWPKSRKFSIIINLIEAEKVYATRATNFVMRNENPSNSHKYQRCHQEERRRTLGQTDINFYRFLSRYEIEKVFRHFSLVSCFKEFCPCLYLFLLVSDNNSCFRGQQLLILCACHGSVTIKVKSNIWNLQQERKMIKVYVDTDNRWQTGKVFRPKIHFSLMRSSKARNTPRHSRNDWKFDVISKTEN